MNMKETQRTQIPPELVLRAQAGDREAFSELYTRSAGAVYRSLRAMLRDEELAWDVHQNSYLLAWQKLGTLQSPEAFLPWLRKIAVREAIRELNREQPLRFTELADEDGAEPPLPETRPGFQPEPELDRREAARLVREILDSLPPKQRLIVSMYYYEEYSVREIAEALEVSQGTVKTQLHLGRGKVEARVKALEQQGVRLWGLSPMAFLTALLRRQEPELPAGRSAPALRAVLNGESVPLTARAVGSGFFHTALGRVTAGLLVLAVAAGGVLGWRALKTGPGPQAGDYRPTQALTVPEPTLRASEGPTELETALPSEVPAAEQRMENPFSGPLESAYPDMLAAIYNEPWDQGLPAPTVNWNAGGEDRLVIYPRYADSVISARRIVYDAEDGPSVEETPVYSTRCGPGDCIAAALERPAEGPCWVLSVRSPDGREASWPLFYRAEGTPRYESICCSTEDADPDAADSELFPVAAEQLLELLGYQTRNEAGRLLPYGSDPRSNPLYALGESWVGSMSRAMTPAGQSGLDLAWNEWFAGEGAVWTVASSRREGGALCTEAGVVHEYYMDKLDREGFVEGQGSPKLSVAEQIQGQARLFAQDRLLGYAGHTAAEGETLYFHLDALLICNPTLAAKTVSVTVNGKDAGEFALREGDVFTWLPLELPNEPGDTPLRLELRVTQTRFGPPEEAVLGLWPVMHSNLRGGL